MATGNAFEVGIKCGRDFVRATAHLDLHERAGILTGLLVSVLEDMPAEHLAQVQAGVDMLRTVIKSTRDPILL